MKRYIETAWFYDDNMVVLMTNTGYIKVLPIKPWERKLSDELFRNLENIFQSNDDFCPSPFVWGTRIYDRRIEGSFTKLQDGYLNLISDSKNEKTRH